MKTESDEPDSNNKPETGLEWANDKLDLQVFTDKITLKKQPKATVTLQKFPVVIQLC